MSKALNRLTSVVVYINLKGLKTDQLEDHHQNGTIHSMLLCYSQSLRDSYEIPVYHLALDQHTQHAVITVISYYCVSLGLSKIDRLTAKLRSSCWKACLNLCACVCQITCEWSNKQCNAGWDMIR